MHENQVLAVDHHHAHHFDTHEQEFSSCKQGMWLFLLQEVLFFSALFVAFFIFRHLYFETFHKASTFLDWKMGGLNTIILICSSVTMARAVTSAQLGYQKAVIRNLCLTFILAGGFCVVKYFEYTHKFHIGLLPGGFFSKPDALLPLILISLFSFSALLMLFYVVRPQGRFNFKSPALLLTLVFCATAVFFIFQYKSFVAAGGTIDPHHLEGAAELLKEFPKIPIFFSIYFVMTGLHGLHVVLGMVAIAWLISRAEKKEFGPNYYTPVEMVGLYWHFVDLVWIYLFPLLYLVG